MPMACIANQRCLAVVPVSNERGFYKCGAFECLENSQKKVGLRIGVGVLAQDPPFLNDVGILVSRVEGVR